MANIIPLSVCNDLANLFNQAQAAAFASNTARAIALKMLGLDPNKQYGIDFSTGLVSDPPGLPTPPVAVEAAPDVSSVAAVEPIPSENLG